MPALPPLMHNMDGGWVLVPRRLAALSTPSLTGWGLSACAEKWTFILEIEAEMEQ